jgi:hypothetical protein
VVLLDTPSAMPPREIDEREILLNLLETHGTDSRAELERLSFEDQLVLASEVLREAWGLPSEFNSEEAWRVLRVYADQTRYQAPYLAPYFGPIPTPPAMVGNLSSWSLSGSDVDVDEVKLSPSSLNPEELRPQLRLQGVVCENYDTSPRAELSSRSLPAPNKGGSFSGPPRNSTRSPSVFWRWP